MRAGPAHTGCSGTDQMRASGGGTRQRNPNPARRRRRVPGPVDLGCGWGAGQDLPDRRLGRRVGAQGLSASFPSLASSEVCHHHRSWLQIPGSRRGTLGHPANSGWNQKPSGGPPLALGPNSWARPGTPGSGLALLGFLRNSTVYSLGHLCTVPYSSSALLSSRQVAPLPSRTEIEARALHPCSTRIPQQ